MTVEKKTESTIPTGTGTSPQPVNPPQPLGLKEGNPNPEAVSKQFSEMRMDALKSDVDTPRFIKEKVAAAHAKFASLASQPSSNNEHS